MSVRDVDDLPPGAKMSQLELMLNESLWVTLIFERFLLHVVLTVYRTSMSLQFPYTKFIIIYTW